MRITILSLLVSFFILTFTACRDDNEAPEAEKRSRTVLVYMVAQNNLSSFAEADFNEMLEGMKSVDDQNNNLIIYWDDKDSKPRLIRLYKDKNGTVKQERLQDYAEQNSVDTEIMKSIRNIRLIVMDWCYGHMLMAGLLIRELNPGHLEMMAGIQ